MITLEDAIMHAARIHKGQVDKGGQPYILHPLWVMSRMTTDTGRQIAVMHDAVEDTGATIDMMRSLWGFSGEVCDAVDALTRRKGESYDDYIERVCANPLAAHVKRWDLIHNMDSSRFIRTMNDHLTLADEKRLAKYERAHKRIMRALLEEP